LKSEKKEKAGTRPAFLEFLRVKLPKYALCIGAIFTKRFTVFHNSSALHIGDRDWRNFTCKPPILSAIITDRSHRFSTLAV
jgi:hypothetical protein